MKSAKPQRTNVWFFVGHSIGVTLLGLHAVESAYFSLKPAERGKCYLVFNSVPNQTYRDLLTMYPHIELVSLDNVWVLTKRYLQSFWVRNFVFHPLAFGQIHYIHAILTWLIVVPRKENRAVLFGEHTGWRRYVATQIVPKDLQQSIFRSMTHAVRVAGLSVTYRKPRLLFAYDVTKQSVLHRPYVVVHPFAASSVRTLPRERWSDLLIFIATTFPAYQIVVSGGPVDRLEAKSLCTAHNKAIFIKEVSASFAETIQIIADAALYVGVDTGPTHLAAHLEVPMIVIGNNSNPCWLPTYAENVTILTHDEHCTCTGDKKGECFVYRDGTRYYRCMIEIPQETITQHISMILRDKQH